MAANINARRLEKVSRLGFCGLDTFEYLLKCEWRPFAKAQRPPQLTSTTILQAIVKNRPRSVKHHIAKYRQFYLLQPKFKAINHHAYAIKQGYLKTKCHASAGIWL